MNSFSEPYVLENNIIGKIIGSPSLKIRHETLILRRRNQQEEQYSLSTITSFPLYSKTLFGYKLLIKIDDSSQQFYLLKSNGIDSFTEYLNTLVVQNLKVEIDQAYQTFFDHVIQQYTRDSWLNELTKLINNLKDRFSAESKKWIALLPSETINKLKEITSFSPVEPSRLRKHHETTQLRKRKVFLDNVESNPLTEQQRLAVLRSNDKNLVLAAAGTGKTSVMVAKALDIIDRGLAKPDEILVVAYNKKAAEELKERMFEKAEKNRISLTPSPDISTFHALGRKILRESKETTYMSVFTEDNLKLKQWLTEWVNQYLKEKPSRIYDIIELSTPPINPFEFKTQRDYERYIRDNEFRTLKGDLVKGYQELLISNFLYVNQVPYEYEARYITKKRVDIGFDYKPDFHILGTNIYIEHFGVDRRGQTRPDIDALKYNDSMRRKREIHSQYGTELIETYHYEWCEDRLEEELERKLARHGINCDSMRSEDLLKELEASGHIASWTTLIEKALQAIRVERLQASDILERLNNAKLHNPQKATSLLDSLHKAYVNELKCQDAIDFDDMIIKAIDAIKLNRFTPKWTYVLVDEFQDISAARMEFIEAIIDKGPAPSLTVVGDDWQSIYRFSGGKLELITRFEERVGSHTKTTLQKTFRYNNSIAKTAGQFIMANPEQYKKEIETHSKERHSQVYLLDDKVGIQDGVYERVVEIIRKIRENDTQGTIAIIARYNYLISDVRKVVSKERLTSDVVFWNFHISKGLEADYCILIGFFQGKSGFPNENREQAVVEALLPSLDAYPHSEERRLLYVGITRAKKKSYLIADPTSPSDFIVELLAPKYEINIASKAFQERYRAIFKCPNCEDGHLRLIKGKFGDFYACSTGLGCNVGKARVCSECMAPSVDYRENSRCNNVSCGHSIDICDQCGRPMKKRSGKYGEFLGCTGYGIKDDQCTNTRKLS